MSLKSKLIQLKNSLLRLRKKNVTNFEEDVRNNLKNKLKEKAVACDKLIEELETQTNFEDSEAKQVFINIIKKYKDSEKIRFTLYSEDFDDFTITYFLDCRESKIILIVRNYDFRLGAASHNYLHTPEEMLSKFSTIYDEHKNDKQKK